MRAAVRAAARVALRVAVRVAVPPQREPRGAASPPRYNSEYALRESYQCSRFAFSWSRVHDSQARGAEPPTQTGSARPAPSHWSAPTLASRLAPAHGLLRRLRASCPRSNAARCGYVRSKTVDSVSAKRAPTGGSGWAARRAEPVLRRTYPHLAAGSDKVVLAGFSYDDSRAVPRPQGTCRHRRHCVTTRHWRRRQGPGWLSAGFVDK